MPRPRTPTSILEARGAYVNHPERRADRVNEPQPSGPLGDPPACLTPYQKAIWHELVAQIPSGVVGNSDRMHFELTVRLAAKIRRGVAKVSEASLLERCLARLGMNPT